MKKQGRPFSPAAAALLFFLLLETALSWMSWHLYADKRDVVLGRDLETLGELYENTQLAYRKLTRLLYDEVINRPDVIAIFERADEQDPQLQQEVRRKLYDRLLPTYERLKSLNLRQLHFHLPDATSFLRFHYPSKYGDSLAGIRYSVEKANREKVYVEGFEEGRVYNGFRHVYPLFDAAGRHLGSVETSLSFAALREDLEATTGDHIDLVVKRAIVEKKVWEGERKHYVPSRLSPAYVQERSSLPESGHDEAHRIPAERLAEEGAARMAKGERFALYAGGYVVAFYPIANVAGDPAAAYMIRYDRTEALESIARSHRFLWGFGSLGAVSAALLLYLLLVKMRTAAHMARYDALTGLLNRHSMGERLDDEIARARRTGDPLALVYVDLDHFKKINDRYGHGTGDTVLRHAARLFSENLRRHDALGRWGGEEFLVCLPHTDLEAARAVAQKLRLAVATYDFELDAPLTCSFGVTCYRLGESAELLLSRADEQLYRAKEEGRDRVCVQE